VLVIPAAISPCAMAAACFGASSSAPLDSVTIQPLVCALRQRPLRRFWTTLAARHGRLAHREVACGEPWRVGTEGCTVSQSARGLMHLRRLPPLHAKTATRPVKSPSSTSVAVGSPMPVRHRYNEGPALPSGRRSQLERRLPQEPDLGPPKRAFVFPPPRSRVTSFSNWAVAGSGRPKSAARLWCRATCAQGCSSRGSPAASRAAAGALLPSGPPLP
jgi:hypothetical protein